jgi:hypothetical protein
MISRRILAAAIALCSFVAPAHAQKTKSALTTEINANWPDNVNGAITPAVLRSTVIDIVNSYYDLNGGTSLACAAHQWVAGLPTLSSLTCTQPAFSDLSGIIAPTQIPAPTATTLGGIESIVSVAHNWISFIDTSGVPHQSQPAFSDLSGTPTCAQQPVLTGGVTTSACAATVVTNANLTGDITSVGNATTLTNAPVIAKVLTGFTSGAGTVSAADSILSALQKINGNDALKAPLASPALTGTPTAPTQAPGDNTTKIATDAFVQAAVTAGVAGVASINGATGAIVGVDTSTINPQTGNYTIATTDNGKIIYATGGQNTITCPSTAGFPAAFTFTIKNGETYTGSAGRAKILSGCPADLKPLLWPQQSTTIKLNSAGSAWVTTHNPGRWIVPTEATLHVDKTNGSNSNDGLAATTGAVQDAQTAWNIQQYQFDNQGTSPIIAMACSQTHTVAMNMGGTPLGTNLVQLSPDGNCTATWTNAGPCIAIADLAELNLNLSFYGSSGSITFGCNSANAANSGNILLHNTVVLDLEGTPIWNPAGTNDNFMYCDGPCKFTIGNGLTQATGAGANHAIHMSAGGSGTQSGVISASGSGGLAAVYWVFGAGAQLSLGTSNGGGWSSVGQSIVAGKAVIITNGVTVAGGAISNTGSGAVCTSLSQVTC